METSKRQPDRTDSRCFPTASPSWSANSRVLVAPQSAENTLERNAKIPVRRWQHRRDAIVAIHGVLDVHTQETHAFAETAEEELQPLPVRQRPHLPIGETLRTGLAVLFGLLRTTEEKHGSGLGLVRPLDAGHLVTRSGQRAPNQSKEGWSAPGPTVGHTWVSHLSTISTFHTDLDGAVRRRCWGVTKQRPPSLEAAVTNPFSSERCNHTTQPVTTRDLTKLKIKNKLI